MHPRQSLCYNIRFTFLLYNVRSPLITRLRGGLRIRFRCESSVSITSLCAHEVTRQVTCARIMWSRKALQESLLCLFGMGHCHLRPCTTLSGFRSVCRAPSKPAGAPRGKRNCSGKKMHAFVNHESRRAFPRFAPPNAGEQACCVHILGSCLHWLDRDMDCPGFVQLLDCNMQSPTLGLHRHRRRLKHGLHLAGFWQPGFPGSRLKGPGGQQSCR